PDLRVQVVGPDRVALVAAQRTTHAGFVADEVLEAAAPLPLAFAIGAGRQLQRPRGQAAAPRPARIEARIAVVEVDHAARMQRIGLRHWRDRQHLHHFAIAVPGRQPQRLRITEAVFVDHARLRLAHALARVVDVGVGHRLARILAHLLRSEAERIARLGDVDVVEYEVQLAAVAQVDTQLEVGYAAPRRGVVAPAIGVQAREREVVADDVVAAEQPRRARPGAVVAHRRPQSPGIARLAVGAVDRDHAARRIAVQRGERTAQDLHAIRAGEAEVRELALAVGHRRRDAVRVQPQPAHPEGRARAEAADGELRVLRQVLPVAREQAGDAAEDFGDVGIGAGALTTEVDG